MTATGPAHTLYSRYSRSQKPPTRTKLTGEDIIAVLEKNPDGMTAADLATEFGTTEEVITSILKAAGTFFQQGDTWRICW